MHRKRALVSCMFGGKTQVCLSGLCCVRTWDLVGAVCARALRQHTHIGAQGRGGLGGPQCQEVRVCAGPLN